MKTVKENKRMVLFVLFFLLLLIFLFYWFQWRPSQIRKECFREVYSNNTNLDWVEGKEWMPYKFEGFHYKYGWLYPYWRLRKQEDVYKGCLIFRGLK
ncbi:MAG: hypothetical protein ABH819_03485 [Patescibacteria group bacterium]